MRRLTSGILALLLARPSAALVASVVGGRPRAALARVTLPAMAGRDGSADESTYWTTLDGRGEDGVGPDGVFPPGDDLVERDLKRIFSIDEDEDGVGESGVSDLDEVALMWKLRQELGDDFNRIFDDPKVRGSEIGF